MLLSYSSLKYLKSEAAVQRGVLIKRYSENMQSNFIEITLQHGCSSVSLLHIFRTPYTKNTSGWQLL